MNAAVEFILEQIRGVWRFRWTAMLVAWLVCLIGWAVVLALPDTYSAWARVFIDTRTRLSQITQGIAVESNIATQAAAVREALLGSPQLQKVARLSMPGYPSAGPAQQNAIIDGLRTRLIVDLAGAGQQHGPGDLYTITYTDTDRATAHRVVDELLKLFLANSLGNSQEGSEQAEQFLVQQIGEYEKKLGTGESRLADFKRQNSGLLPGATGDYFQRLQAAKDELAHEQNQVTVAQQRRDELQRQLSSEQPVLGGGSAGAGGGDTASQIRQTQARLDELLLRFTDQHPDVIAARRELEDLQKRQKLEIAAVRRGDPAAIAATGLASNPVYQGIRLQLSNADVELAAARRQMADQESKIQELQKMINTAPQVEAEFARLNRDYDVTRTEYQALVDRLNRARLSDRADATGVVRFQVVDPPTGSTRPISPDRPRLIMVVLLGGVLAGLAVAYLLHQLRPVFTSARQLTDYTQLPVLGVVSMTWLERHKARERRALWVYSGATAILVALGLLVLLTESIASRLLHGVIA
ncbi:MAG TPA: XrtA system polysaccharide chain length determinant [Steroidobacteraceae bacterium]|nr:XrtA system polysaccharide chain length determinant [Steroidobacteraceae bacterium]